MGTKDIKKEDLDLGDQIGSGGYGTVFKAKLNGQEVAVKKLPAIDRHEVDVLATLDHPHIVKFIGALEENLNLYLVLELCKGGSLRSFLDRKRFKHQLLPIYNIYDWARQAIRPIQYLHARNLVHKDIKTSNFLIADGNILKLADFGITKNIESTIQNATKSCTPAYSSPEFLMDDILSPSYDINAYGVVLWELCTTLVPFEGSSSNHIIWRICGEKERPVIPENCPKPLADVMTKCWEVDRKKRPNPEQILQMLSLPETPTFIAGPWKCETEFGQHGHGKLRDPAGIATNPTTQDVAVCDRRLNKVLVYCSTGEFKFDIALPCALGVVVSNNGNYHITNLRQCVHCYNQSGVYTNRWVAASPDNTPLDSEDTVLGGLAIDHRNNLLLVGVTNHNFISKHNIDGSHVNSIKVNIKPHFLSVTTYGTIIISETYSKAQIADQTGQTLYTLEPRSHQVTEWLPHAVCCHEGIIFICNILSKQIECFSMHGDYVGCITLDINPYDITFVPGQKKFLVSSFGNKVQMYSCPH